MNTRQAAGTRRFFSAPPAAAELAVAPIIGPLRKSRSAVASHLPLLFYSSDPWRAKRVLGAAARSFVKQEEEHRKSILLCA